MHPYVHRSKVLALSLLAFASVWGGANAHATPLGASLRCVAIGSAAGCGHPAEPRILDGEAAIAQKLAQVSSALGRALDVQPLPLQGGGLVRRFERGAIYWAADLGAFMLSGAIYLKYGLHGQTTGALGYPISDEIPLFDEQQRPEGSVAFFENGAIYSHVDLDIGTHVVVGALAGKHAQLALDQVFLGYPLNDTQLTADRRGLFNEFENGVIYWTSDHGAFEVHGRILREWDALGREASPLGFPTSDEESSSDGGGRRSFFENGVIYHHDLHGTHAVHGDILEKWASQFFDVGPLGYPISGVEPAVSGGRRVRFQYGGIYSHPTR